MTNREWIMDVLEDGGYRKLVKRILKVCKKDGGCRECESCDCGQLSKDLRDWMNSTKQEVNK